MKRSFRNLINRYAGEMSQRVARDVEAALQRCMSEGHDVELVYRNSSNPNKCAFDITKKGTGRVLVTIHMRDHMPVLAGGSGSSDWRDRQPRIVRPPQTRAMQP